MKQPKVSKDMIFKYMKRYRIKFVIIELVLIAILVAYFMWCKPYIMNIFEGASPFDEKAFASDNLTYTVEPVEVHRNDDLKIPSYALRSWVHWQGDKYEFDIKLKDVKKTDIVFDLKTSDDTTGTQSSKAASVIYTATVGGKKVLVLAFPYDNLKDGDTVAGIFTQMPKVVKYEIGESANFKHGEVLSGYMIDTRGIEVESEEFDTVFCIILLLIILYLAFKLIRQFVNYKKTPTYRQLEQYDDCLNVEKEILKELDEGYIVEKKSIETKSWIIEKDVFKLKIVKNHKALGKFEYIRK